jgi:uncharacterized protein (TIGR03067 family)
MNRLLIAAILIALVPATHADDKPLTGDLAKIQGVWKGKTGRDGQFETVMTVKGNSGAYDNTTRDGSKIGLTYKLEIDEKAEPRRIHMYEVTRYGGNGSGPEEVFGIYKFIDDDTIMLCNGFDGKYPAEFKGREGTSTVFTLKRETKETKPEK